MNRTAEDTNLADVDAFARNEHWALFRVLREQAPLHRNRGDGSDPTTTFWSITRHADILNATRQRTVFSSETRHATIPQPIDLFDLGEFAPNQMLLNMDDPRHVRFRQLVLSGFTPTATARWEPLVRQMCDDLLDDIAEGECEFAERVAAQLPMLLIASMLGVPAADRAPLLEIVNKVGNPTELSYQNDLPNGIEPGTPEAVFATASAGWIGTVRYFDKLIVGRRRAEVRGDDLISILEHAEVDGSRLTHEELCWFCVLLFGAGSETTRNAIAGGLLALSDHPEQRRRLVEQPSLLPTAVEEIMRYVSPANFLPRWATRDVEMHGQTIARGDTVNLWFASGNRDERVFRDPEAFDISRTPNDHMAFGSGGHFCLGAALARLETRVALQRILTRFPEIVVTRAERIRTNTANGWTTMHVVAGKDRGRSAEDIGVRDPGGR